MKDEISAAVLFLTRLIGKNENLNQTQIEEFKATLNNLLVQRFKNHWFPDKPFKGQGYRCIRVNEMDRKDPVLERAARECGLKYEDLQLPVELTVWVDPTEVCCRFGEHKGSYCTVASFKEVDKENFVDHLKIEEMEPSPNECLSRENRSPKKAASSKNKTVTTGGLVYHPPPQLAHQTYFHQSASFSHHQQAYSHYGSSPPSLIYLPTTAVSSPSITNSTFTTSLTPYGKIRIHENRILPHHAAFATFPHLFQQQIAIPNNDRYHWVNKALVKSAV